MKKEGLTLNKTALVSALMLATGAQAAVIFVDNVTCTLNDAVVSANTDTATGGCLAGDEISDRIELPDDSTVNLSETLLIEAEVVLNANGSTIQPDPGGSAFRIFEVSGSEADLIINDAILTNGGSTSNLGNGALASYGANMEINRSTISGNIGGGVGFFVEATGRIYDSVIINNAGNDASVYYGSGLLVSSSTVTVANSTISGNTNNATSEGGAGIQVTNFPSNYGYGTSTLNLTNTTITGNTSLTRGAGIFIYSSSGNTPSVINMTNVTLAANSSSAGFGGGLSSDGATITISQSLISGNSGLSGGIDEIYAPLGTVTVDDYNIFGLNSNAGVVGVTVGASDIVPTEAAITDIVDVNLQDNGGRTLTHLPVASGPAINVIPSASCALGTDQIGNSRPLGSGCEIGAVELDAPATFFVGGNIAGLLAGNTVTLQNNGGDDLVVSDDGAFVFNTALNNTEMYEVTVSTQPTSPNQECLIANESGIIADADVVNVNISCDSFDLIFRDGFDIPPEE